ncbi:MAG: putative immunity protein [Amnibacterium sp.]
MILPAERDPRLVTVRRGGTLSDPHHRLLALWAAACAERVLPLFAARFPDDHRPLHALAAVRRWADGALRMTDCRRIGFDAGRAGRGTDGAARFSALAAAQAAAVPHVAEHELGAAAYALRAVDTARGVAAARAERDRQRELLPADILALVLDDQRRRDALCWSVFSR